MIDIIKQNTYAQLVFIGLTLIASTLVFTALAFGISVVAWGMDTTTSAMSGEMNTQIQISILKLLQFASQLGMFIVPPMALWLIMRQNNDNYLGLSNTPSPKQLLYVIAFFIAFIPFLQYTIVLNESMSLGSYFSDLEEWMREKQDINDLLTEKFLSGNGASTLIINLILMALMPAIGEELMFRGLLMNWFKKAFDNIHIVIFITAVIFSAIHMQFYGFIPRFLLGIALGYIYHWTKNLWAPILLHFINNATTVVVYYYINSSNSGIDPKDVGTVDSPILIIASLLASLAILRLIRGGKE